MGEENQQIQKPYLLLLEFITDSLSPNVLLFFKPEEILRGESFKLKLKITNKTTEHFPGAEIINAKLLHQAVDIFDDLPDSRIPSLAPGESCDIDCGNWHAFSSNIINFELKLRAIDSRTINCYQKLHASNRLELMKNRPNYWVDFIHISTKSEIQQKYTNIILISLTVITVAYYISTIFIKFPI